MWSLTSRLIIHSVRAENNSTHKFNFNACVTDLSDLLQRWFTAEYRAGSIFQYIQLHILCFKKPLRSLFEVCCSLILYLFHHGRLLMNHQASMLVQHYEAQFYPRYTYWCHLASWAGRHGCCPTLYAQLSSLYEVYRSR